MRMTSCVLCFSFSSFLSLSRLPVFLIAQKTEQGNPEGVYRDAVEVRTRGWLEIHSPQTTLSGIRHPEERAVPYLVPSTDDVIEGVVQHCRKSIVQVATCENDGIAILRYIEPQRKACCYVYQRFRATRQRNSAHQRGGRWVRFRSQSPSWSE